MQSRFVTSLGFIALAFGLVCPARAAMYQWIDADGHLTFSNQPPADAARVRALERIESPGEALRASRARSDEARRPSPTETGNPMRTAPAEPRRAGQSLAAADESVAPRPPERALARALGRVNDAPAHRSATDRLGPGVPDPAPRTTPPRVYSEAVRDPCLRSADPRCYERNRDRYHPYLGYAPGATQSATGAPIVEAATGATSGRAAENTVSGPSPPAAAALRRGEPESPAPLKFQRLP